MEMLDDFCLRTLSLLREDEKLTGNLEPKTRIYYKLRRAVFLSRDFLHVIIILILRLSISVNSSLPTTSCITSF
jgi:hypothetical protein